MREEFSDTFALLLSLKENQCLRVLVLAPPVWDACPLAVCMTLGHAPPFARRAMHLFSSASAHTAQNGSGCMRSLIQRSRLCTAARRILLVGISAFSQNSGTG